MSTDTMISKSDFLNHWLGHRQLTKKTIEKFPDSEFFTFSIGGMRPFADLIKELLAIDAPGMKEMATGEPVQFNYDLPLKTKEDFLNQWDEDTSKIADYFDRIPSEKLGETHKLFGMYEFTILGQCWYMLDNEIHHRAQGYVYLRSLGIEPPAFWERPV